MDSISKLLDIFHITNGWLKFAEAKNAIALAFSGAAITAVATYLSAASNVLASIRVGLYFSVLFLCVSAFIASLSFLPTTDLNHFLWYKMKPSRRSKNQPQNTDNLYFFGDLQKYIPTSFLEAFDKSYFDGNISKPYSKEHVDIASQIIANSEIATIKFSLFRFSAWGLLVSILAVPISLLVNFLIFRKL